MSFLWSAHYKSMGEKSYTTKTQMPGSNRSEWGRIRLVLMSLVLVCISDPLKGHLRSHTRSYMFLLITFDRIEIEAWDRCQCVCLIKTHHVTRIMTYLGYFRSLRDIVLRSILKLTFWSQIIYCSMRLDEANTMVPLSTLNSSNVESYSRKMS